MFNMLKVLGLKLEEAESQRKKDAEKVEAQRKKDAEKFEAQRKNDQADAKEQIRKIELGIKDLEYNIKRLEQCASERALERKQKDEATQRYIESLADDIEATTDFLALGVRPPLLSPFLPFTPL